MSIWRIQYQDDHGASQICFGEQDDRPSPHEAMEIVVQSLILAAHTGMSAVPYLTLLSADALSEFRIRFISPVSVVTQSTRETKCPPGR
jgi:hypothetical protein